MEGRPGEEDFSYRPLVFRTGPPQRFKIPTYPSSDFLGEALQIALVHGRTFYDSLYVALAARTKTNLITADERLANALAAHLPVKWLGAM